MSISYRSVRAPCLQHSPSFRRQSGSCREMPLYKNGGVQSVSRTKSSTTHIVTNSPSPQKPAPKPNSSQVTSITPSTRDPGKIESHDQTRDLTRDPSRDPHPERSCDLARDPGKPTHDLPRDWSFTRSQDHPRFGRATRPLIGTWKTVGTINKDPSRRIKSQDQCAVTAA